MKPAGKFGAEYRCLSCGAEWTGFAGPQDFQPPGGSACPRCPSLYVKWLNYEQMFGKPATKEKRP